MHRDEEQAVAADSDAHVHLPEYNVPRHGYGKMHDEVEAKLPSPAAPQTAAASPAAGTSSPTGAARFQSLEPPKTILPSVVNVSDKVLFKYIILGGSLLAFNAGYMNCVALQSHVQQVVSHVTGHATKAAVELGSLEMGDFVHEWALLILFGFGSSLTGWMIGKEKLTLGQSYGRLLITIGFIVFIAMVSGEQLLHSVLHTGCFCTCVALLQPAQTIATTAEIVYKVLHAGCRKLAAMLTIAGLVGVAACITCQILLQQPH
jgi:hypothetical protein